jgi:nicotinamide mononucleotide (NMN) deamidase PncC
MSKQPSFKELIPDDPSTISKMQHKAREKGYELLALIDSMAVWADKKIPGSVDRYLQIATSESLTCGLIMSTLVDIPWAGYAKYGGFGVYDTDAKRVFNSVKVDNVYTHKCASEMAIGVLKNSNATIAIAVTGNAMPLNEHVDMIGEVFIGIAGYNEDGRIIYETTALNACKTDDRDLNEFKQTCSDWYDTITAKKTWNPRHRTATVSQEIRYYTALKAYEQCINFIKIYNPSVPDEILQRKEINATPLSSIDDIHANIPPPRFNIDDEGICMEIENGKPKPCTTPLDKREGALYDQTSMALPTVENMLLQRENPLNSPLFRRVTHSKSPSKTKRDENEHIQRHRSAIQPRRSAVERRSPSLHSNRHSAERRSPRDSPRSPGHSRRPSRRGRSVGGPLRRGRSLGGQRRTRSNNRRNKRTIHAR